jgi:hypothetical protein
MSYELDFFYSPLHKMAIDESAVRLKPKREERIFDRYKNVTLERLDKSILKLESRLNGDIDSDKRDKCYMWKVISRPNGYELIEVWLKIGRMLAYITEKEKRLRFEPNHALAWLKDIHSLIFSCEADKGIGKYLHKLAIEQSWPKAPPTEDGMHIWEYSHVLDKFIPSKKTQEEQMQEMVSRL